MTTFLIAPALVALAGPLVAIAIIAMARLTAADLAPTDPTRHALGLDRPSTPSAPTPARAPRTSAGRTRAPRSEPVRRLNRTEISHG